MDVLDRGNGAEFGQNEELGRFCGAPATGFWRWPAPVAPIWGIGLAAKAFNLENPRVRRGATACGGHIGSLLCEGM